MATSTMYALSWMTTTAGKLGHKAIAVVASTAAKMGAGWKPVVQAKTDQDQRQAPGGVHLPAVRPGANR